MPEPGGENTIYDESRPTSIRTETVSQTVEQSGEQTVQAVPTEAPAEEGASAEAAEAPVEQTEVPAEEATEQAETPPPTPQSLEWANGVFATTKEIRSNIETHRDLREVAEFVGKNDENVDIKGILETKKIGEGVATPEVIKDEFSKIEESIIKPLAEKLDAANIEQQEKDRAVTSVRESLYGLISAGIITADKLNNFISEISFEEKAPTTNQTRVEQGVEPAARFNILQSEDGAIGKIVIYRQFINSDNDQQAFIIRHEASHILAHGIWGPAYKKFLAAAENPNEQSLVEFDQQPELKQILKVLIDPAAHRAAFRGYLQKKIDLLPKQNEEGAKKMRRLLANEMVADLLSHYMEAGGNKPIENFSYRARFLKPQEIAEYCFRALDATEQEDFFAKLGLPEEADRTPEKVIEALSKQEKVEALFGVNALWAEKLQKRFANRGENLISLPEEESRDTDDVASTSFSTGGSGSDGSVDRGVFSTGGKDPMEWFWKIVIGPQAGK